MSEHDHDLNFVLLRSFFFLYLFCSTVHRYAEHLFGGIRNYRGTNGVILCVYFFFLFVFYSCCFIRVEDYVRTTPFFYDGMTCLARFVFTSLFFILLVACGSKWQAQKNLFLGIE